MARETYPMTGDAAGRALGSALRRLGYGEQDLLRLLGDEAYSADRRDAPVLERRLPRTRLASAIRLLFLGLPLDAGEAERALGARGLAALEATGLAEVGADVVPRSRVTVVGGLLLASDGWSRDAQDPPDYVATYTPTSRLCDLLTPRPRVERALDVGTGNGIHALLAARHAGRVVATDVNPRALAYTRLNAALNGLRNVECRPGSLFDPVAGETFGLVTCNAPYVVSPESRWAYRDGGREGDEVSRGIVAGAAAHLEPGGHATLLVSWLATDEDALDERALAWVEASGCDGWIVPVFGSDPLDHAAGWNDHLAGDAAALGAALDGWTGYLERLGARWISEGGILLHSPDALSGRRRSIRVDPADADALEPAGPQILRAFAGRERLSRLRRRADLLGERPRPAPGLRLELELEPHRGRATVTAARVRLAAGTQPSVETSALAAEVAGSLDGRTTLERAVQTVAALHGLASAREATLRRQALALARELVELGALEL